MLQATCFNSCLILKSYRLIVTAANVENMKLRTSYLSLLGISITTLIIGCNSLQPLTLRHYSKNIIANKDKTLFLEKDQIDFKNLRHELVRRLITTTTPIAVHIHKDLPPNMAEALLDKLKAEGFTNVQIVIFTD